MGEPALQLTLPAVLGAALIDSLNPCAFALLLVFVATTLALVQQRVGSAGAAHAQYWLLSRGGVYILGIFLTYLALGFGLLGTLELAQSLSSTHLASRAAALFALGLGLLTLQEVLLPELGTRLSAQVDMARLRELVGRLNVPGLFGAGVLVGLCTVPCAGAVYLAVLALLSAQTTALAGAGYLVLYNLVFVSPLVVLLALSSSPPVYRQLARWQVHHRVFLKLGTSVAAIAVGLLTLLVV
ncbi:MAG: cytochrome C biogenesis protein [Chloroflexi bacterium]|nr:cytochrome C biogenesis protein [Chloroflexota bacterium]